MWRTDGSQDLKKLTSGVCMDYKDLANQCGSTILQNVNVGTIGIVRTFKAM